LHLIRTDRLGGPAGCAGRGPWELVLPCFFSLGGCVARLQVHVLGDPVKGATVAGTRVALRAHGRTESCNMVQWRCLSYLVWGWCAVPLAVSCSGVVRVFVLGPHSRPLGSHASAPAVHHEHHQLVVLHCPCDVVGSGNDVVADRCLEPSRRVKCGTHLEAAFAPTLGRQPGPNSGGFALCALYYCTPVQLAVHVVDALARGIGVVLGTVSL
jgi:hypothetical protein